MRLRPAAPADLDELTALEESALILDREYLYTAFDCKRSTNHPDRFQGAGTSSGARRVGSSAWICSGLAALGNSVNK